MNQFKVYKSSAGSGKTFTLVKEYLKLCLSSSNPFQFSKILAITFTNKASNEMKERVLLALTEISEANDLKGTSLYLKQILMEELNISEKTITSQCGKILESILHNYSDFNISTIDKFSHKLVRTFAKDLDLSVSFKVDLEEVELLEKVIGKLISLIGKENDLTKLIIAHSKYKIEDGSSWNPIADLVSVSKKLLADEGIEQLQKITSISNEEVLEIRKKLRKQNQVFEKGIVGIGEKALALISENNLEGKLFNPRSALPSYFKKLCLFKYLDFEPTNTVLNVFREDKWYAGSATEVDKLAIDSIKDELTDLYNNSRKIIEAELAGFISKKLIGKNIYLVALLKRISTEFSKLKQEERIVPISDFNKKISGIVLQESMPFIYERIGEKYDHLMIDEFQDTSIMQFMNLVPLIEESLSRGNFNMIVGDAKQSIYRFRGAEVEQFSEMPDYLPNQYEENKLVIERLSNLKQFYKAENLAFNFRSQANLVSFNNQFFQNFKSQLPEKIQTIFYGHEQKVLSKSLQGYVNIKFLPNDNYSEVTVNQVYLDIVESIEDNYRYGDIAILCKAKKNAVLVSEYLKEQGVPILSSESLLISAVEEIKLLISTAYWVLDQSDEAKKKEILSYLVHHKLIDLTLIEAFKKYVKEKREINRLLAEYGFEMDTQDLSSMPVYEFFEALIRIYKFTKPFDVYIQFFQETVFDFNTNESSGIGDFLIWWETKMDELSISVPEGINAVQIMTIHKSKGLEFPVVICPFLDRKITNNFTEYLWVDSSNIDENLNSSLVEYKKELNESSFNSIYNLEREKRLMDLANETYVALTRASERMYLRANIPSKNASEINLPSLMKSSIGMTSEIEEGEYVFGKRVKVNKIDEDEIVPSILTEYISEAWGNKIKISSDSESIGDKERLLNPQYFGTLFHDIMSKINTKEDVVEIIKQYQLEGRINKEESIYLENLIEKALNNENLGQFFEPNLKIRKELDFFTEDGNTIRPDRVILYDNRIVVLDYKTGLINEKHDEQIKNYTNHISKVSKVPVYGYLYYLDNFDLRKVV